MFTVLLAYRSQKKMNFTILPPPPMGCCAAEATDLGFVCFVVINCQPTELIWAFFLFHNFSNFTPPPPSLMTTPDGHQRAAFTSQDDVIAKIARQMAVCADVRGGGDVV